jgi:hypothetical protein
LLDLSAKKTKKRQDWQAYSRLYWDRKLKEEVQDEWDAHKKTMLEKATNENAKPPTFPDSAPLPFRNKAVQRLFVAESPEVKDEVEKSCYRNGSTVANKAGNDITMDEKEAQRAARAEQYHE